MTSSSSHKAAFDFSKLSKPQLDALCSAAFGGHGAGCSPRTLAVLEAHGLIERSQRTVGRDRFGPIEVPDWETPMHVHVAFCAWCAEHAREDGTVAP